MEIITEYVYNEPDFYTINLKMSQEPNYTRKVERQSHLGNSSLDLFICSNCEVTATNLVPVNLKTFEYFYHLFCRVMDLPKTKIDLQSLNFKYGLRFTKIQKEIILPIEKKTKKQKKKRKSVLYENNKDENDKFYQNYRNDSELQNQENTFGSRNFLILNTMLMFASLIIINVNTVTFTTFYNQILSIIQSFKMDSIVSFMDIDVQSLVTDFKTRAYQPAFQDKDYFNGSIFVFFYGIFGNILIYICWFIRNAIFFVNYSQISFLVLKAIFLMNDVKNMATQLFSYFSFLFGVMIPVTLTLPILLSSKIAFNTFINYLLIFGFFCYSVFVKLPAFVKKYKENAKKLVEEELKNDFELAKMKKSMVMEFETHQSLLECVVLSEFLQRKLEDHKIGITDLMNFGWRPSERNFTRIDFNALLDLPLGTVAETLFNGKQLKVHQKEFAKVLIEVVQNYGKLTIANIQQISRLFLWKSYQENQLIKQEKCLRMCFWKN